MAGEEERYKVYKGALMKLFKKTIDDEANPEFAIKGSFIESIAKNGARPYRDSAPGKDDGTGGGVRGAPTFEAVNKNFNPPPTIAQLIVQASTSDVLDIGVRNNPEEFNRERAAVELRSFASEHNLIDGDKFTRQYLDALKNGHNSDITNAGKSDIRIKEANAQYKKQLEKLAEDYSSALATLAVANPKEGARLIGHALEFSAKGGNISEEERKLIDSIKSAPMPETKKPGKGPEVDKPASANELKEKLLKLKQSYEKGAVIADSANNDLGGPQYWHSVHQFSPGSFCPLNEHGPSP